MSSDIVIIGGGLQGASIALELANRGKRVTLIERDHQIMNRASLRNEGKIHLGLIYAADETMRTAKTQLVGAFSFFPLINRWLGDEAKSIGISTPFCYLVADDSLKSPDELEEHYGKLSDFAREFSASNSSMFYPGYDGGALAQPAEPARSNWFSKSKVTSVFDTAEIAINTDSLAKACRQAVLAHPDIEVLCDRYCKSITRHSSGIRLQGGGADGAWTLEAEQVVNCSWENRLLLDAQMDLAAPSGWVHRLKYRLIAQLPAAMLAAPSATIVLGPYGDVVVRDDGRAYLSWYPTGCKGWSHELAPPESWNDPCRGDPDQDVASTITHQAMKNLAEWYPAIMDATPLYVDAGAIVAYGKTDVDDPDSKLHDRTRIGVFGDDDYLSVDPGKLTTAPYYAVLAADKITGDQSGFGALTDFQ